MIMMLWNSGTRYITETNMKIYKQIYDKEEGVVLTKLQAMYGKPKL